MSLSVFLYIFVELCLFVCRYFVVWLPWDVFGDQHLDVRKKNLQCVSSNFVNGGSNETVSGWRPQRNRRRSVAMEALIDLDYLKSSMLERRLKVLCLS